MSVEIETGCCSAISPCAHQRKDPGSLCDVCLRAALVVALREGRVNRLTPSGRVVLDQPSTAGLMAVAADFLERTSPAETAQAVAAEREAIVTFFANSLETTDENFALLEAVRARARARAPSQETSHD